MATANELIAKGFKGYQGWGDAEANADFNATGGSGKGGSAGGTSLGTSFAPSMDRTAFNQGQANLQGDFLNRYTGAIQGLESPSAMAARLGSELGLPALNKSAFSLNQTLADIPSVQTGATRGFDVNANQLARIIAAKQGEIAPLAQRATAQAQEAQGELGTQMGYEQQGQEHSMLPYQMEQSQLSDRLARESTGYNTDRQNELDLYLNRLARGEKLSDAETARTQALADMETTFEQQKKLTAFNTDEAIRQNKALKAGTRSSAFSYIPPSTTKNTDPMSGQSLSSIVGF